MTASFERCCCTPLRPPPDYPRRYCSRNCPYAHIHTYIHTYKHKHTYIHMHTCIHTYIELMYWYQNVVYVVCTYIHTSFTSIPLRRAFSDVYIHTYIHTHIHTYAYREFQQMSRCMSRMFLTGWNPFFAKISEITQTSTPLHTLHRMYVSMYVVCVSCMYVCMYVWLPPQYWGQ